MKKYDKKEPAAHPGYLPALKMSFFLPKYWPTWLGIFILWLLMYLPCRVKGKIAAALSYLSCRSNKKRYHIAKKNLSMCFPEKTEAELELMVSRFFYYKARIFLDYAYVWFGSEKKLAEVYQLKNDDELQKLKQANKKVILLTCHMLGLDQGSQALSFDNEIVSMVKAMKNPVLDWVIGRGRTRFNTHVYERSYGLTGIIASVKAGDQFIYLPDEDLSGGHSEFVPFFGVQKSTITALGRLAKICDAKVVPFVSVFNDMTGKYEAHFLPSMSHFPTGDKIADTLAMNQVFEKMILKAPEQYLWTFRYFQTRPEGEPSVY
ncbi:MAG: lipid A biosynthesis acyltransferase [Gammaproteobacteria bacterium]|nr:lipid A biosynthesis acyltransferase [Gammaproteobacteria bacterium]